MSAHRPVEERPYECPICGRRFSRPDLLVQHTYNAGHHGFTVAGRRRRPPWWAGDDGIVTDDVVQAEFDSCLGEMGDAVDHPHGGFLPSESDTDSAADGSQLEAAGRVTVRQEGSAKSTRPPLSLNEDLADWMMKSETSRDKMDDLVKRLQSHGIDCLPLCARTLVRRAAQTNSVEPVDNTRWASLWAGVPDAPEMPKGAIFSVWDWAEMVLQSEYLRCSLVVDPSDPRVTSADCWWCESFRSPEFLRLLADDRREGIDWPLFVVLYCDGFQPFHFSPRQGSVCGTYFTLANFPRHVATKVRNIFTLGLTQARKRAVRAVLALFVRCMSSERKISVCGRMQRVRLRLFCVLADMKERNSLTSVVPTSGKYFCHRCTASKSDVLELGDPRTREQSVALSQSPTVDCKLKRRIEEGKTIHRLELHGLMIADVAENPLFHVPSWDPHSSVCCDYAHDELLGLCKYEIESCLDTLSAEGAERLLDRMHSRGMWPRGVQKCEGYEAFKPGMTKGAEVESVMMVAPFLFAGLIRKSRMKTSNASVPIEVNPDERLKCLVLHCEIIRDIVTMTSDAAKKVSVVDSLRMKIMEHSREFIRLNPECEYLPKLHSRLHYFEQILRYGPLLLSSTMRFESRHQPFKRQMARGGGAAGADKLVMLGIREAGRQATRGDLDGLYAYPARSSVDVVPWRIFRPGDQMFTRLQTWIEAHERKCPLRVDLDGPVPLTELWAWKSIEVLGLSLRSGDDIRLLDRANPSSGEGQAMRAPARKKRRRREGDGSGESLLCYRELGVVWARLQLVLGGQRLLATHSKDGWMYYLVVQMHKKVSVVPKLHTISVELEGKTRIRPLEDLLGPGHVLPVFIGSTAMPSEVCVVNPFYAGTPSGRSTGGPEQYS